MDDAPDFANKNSMSTVPVLYRATALVEGPSTRLLLHSTR